jgi:hypothetical protein
MRYLVKFKNWFLTVTKYNSSFPKSNKVIMPKEITPIDLRFEDIK